MCGISGIIALEAREEYLSKCIAQSTEALEHRGPDDSGMLIQTPLALGHRRLSIIDLSPGGHQPMRTDDGRHALIFNGEFYNYLEHRRNLQTKGITFRGESDTEVLLHLLIREGMEALQKVNGFFAFAFCDFTQNLLYLGRDRFGIKPLYVYRDEERIAFASEIKALLPLMPSKKINTTALHAYLQLNYIPHPYSIFEGVQKLLPGHILEVSYSQNIIAVQRAFYQLPVPTAVGATYNYDAAKKELHDLLTDSISMRLVADVPVGTFLSGGLDSSIISALAAQLHSDIDTFSIGFSDRPYYDETKYASAVAKKIGARHHVFSLSDKDLLESCEHVLEYTDEPFADSSALNVFVLSRETRKKVTVALAGDGADELFGGYRKHLAEARLLTGLAQDRMLDLFAPILKNLPASRHSRWGDIVRKAIKYTEVRRLSQKERFIYFASLRKEAELQAVITGDAIDTKDFRNALFANENHVTGMNGFLRADITTVLPCDMLYKVDSMSMANSLEVRVPFLDHNLVNFAQQLPDKWKVDRHIGKKILRDTFGYLLPTEVLQRGKKGFEVPLYDWFHSAWRHRLNDTLNAKSRIVEHGWVSAAGIELEKAKLYSNSPGDSAAFIWNLLVLENWSKRYFD